jgi:hypothetical protein
MNTRAARAAHAWLGATSCAWCSGLHPVHERLLFGIRERLNRRVGGNAIGHVSRLHHLGHDLEARLLVMQLLQILPSEQRKGRAVPDGNGVAAPAFGGEHVIDRAR